MHWLWDQGLEVSDNLSNLSDVRRWWTVLRRVRLRTFRSSPTLAVGGRPPPDRPEMPRRYPTVLRYVHAAQHGGRWIFHSGSRRCVLHIVSGAGCSRPRTGWATSLVPSGPTLRGWRSGSFCRTRAATLRAAWICDSWRTGLVHQQTHVRRRTPSPNQRVWCCCGTGLLALARRYRRRA